QGVLAPEWRSRFQQGKTATSRENPAQKEKGRNRDRAAVSPKIIIPELKPFASPIFTKFCVACTSQKALALRYPTHSQLLAFFRTVEKIKIDQLLVGKPCLLRHPFEIVHHFRAQVDPHGLFLTGIRVLQLLQFGKIIFLLHKISPPS